MEGPLIIGAGLVLAILGFIALAGEKGWKFSWWHWFLMAIGGAIFLYGVAFLGTSYGEGTPGAGWLMFGITLVFSAIIGTIVGRTFRRA